MSAVLYSAPVHSVFVLFSPQKAWAASVKWNVAATKSPDSTSCVCLIPNGGFVLCLIPRAIILWKEWFSATLMTSLLDALQSTVHRLAELVHYFTLSKVCVKAECKWSHIWHSLMHVAATENQILLLPVINWEKLVLGIHTSSILEVNLGTSSKPFTKSSPNRMCSNRNREEVCCTWMHLTCI